MRQALNAIVWLGLALVSLALGWLYSGLPRAALWLLAPFLAVIGLAIAVNCTVDCVHDRIARQRLKVRAAAEDTCTTCGSVLARMDEVWVCARCDGLLGLPQP
jgi:ribosomal protein S27AE